MTGDRVSPSGEVGFDPSTDDVPAALAPDRLPGQRKYRLVSGRSIWTLRY